MSDPVQLNEWDDRPVGEIRLNRPDKYNACTEQLMDQLGAGLRRWDEDGEVRVVVLTGEGPAFCAGADMDDILGPRTAVEGHRDMLELQKRNIRAFTGCSKPVVSMVNGPAVGGGLCFALASDLVVCSTEAYFEAPFAKIGLVPDAGLAWTLLQSVGLHRAREILLTGGRFGPDQAMEWGWVNRVVEPGELRGETESLVDELLETAPLALEETKSLINAALAPDLDGFLDEEALRQGILMATEDVQEAREAFEEGRDPDFEGR